VLWEQQANQLKRHAVAGFFKIQRRHVTIDTPILGILSIEFLSRETDMIPRKGMPFHQRNNSLAQTSLDPLKINGFR
jgi:hypothetical protein